MTEKVANYSPEVTEALVKAYVEAPTHETVVALAEKFGKSVNSIVAKLAREGVYKAKAKEAGKREMLKAEMVAEISKEIGVAEETLESLEKATGPALMAVLRALKGE